MKKTVALMLSLLLAAVLAACGGKTPAPGSSTVEQQAPPSAQTQDDTDGPGSAPNDEAAEAAAEETTEAPADEATETTDSDPAQAASLLSAVWDSMDSEQGVHLTYLVKMEQFDFPQQYDVYGTRERTAVSLELLDEAYAGYKTITVCQDNRVYSLQTVDMTGIYVDSPTPVENTLIVSDVYNAIFCKQGTPFTPLEKEQNGVTYQAEYYPATENYPVGTTFCFDDEGRLCWLIRDPLEGIDESGLAYQITGIDDQMDESLFDLSAYQVRSYEEVMEELNSAQAENP